VLEFNENVDFMPRIAELARQKLEEQINTGVIGRDFITSRLYVFGAARAREAQVYLAPGIPNVDTLAEYIRVTYNVPVAVERIGNPAQEAWLAFRRTIRRKDPEVCAKLCVLTLLQLNNLINW
jgi:hypothetical protein